MSNTSIIERLVSDIVKCGDRPHEKQVLAKRILASIEAMDGVPYEKIKEADRFEQLLTISAFHDEEGFEGVPNLAEAKGQLISWLKALEASLLARGIE